MQPQFDDEMLVAYLDGELPSEQKVTLEQNLQSDNGLRQRISALRASWDLLAELPLEEPRRDLAQSTIEIVTLALEKESRSWLQWLITYRWLALAVAGLVALVLGAAASRGMTRHWTRNILRNLPAIVEYRSLENIDSVDFLKQLALIENLVEAAGNPSGQPVIGERLVPRDLAERRTWVEELSEVDSGKLESNLLLFLNQSESRKAELNSMTDWLQADDSSADSTTAPSRLQVVRAYNAILEKLGSKQVLRLQEMPVSQRLAEINDRVCIEMALNFVPGPEDRSAILGWLDDLRFKEENYDQLNFKYDPDSHIIFELINRDAQDSFVSQQDVQDLHDRLTPKAQKLLYDLANAASQRYHLGLWVSSVVQSTYSNNGTPRVSDVDIETRFEELSRDRRDELELMPADEVVRILRQNPVPPAPPVTPAAPLRALPIQDL